MTDVLFQARVGAWMLECFGEEIASDRIERADRFVEEALKLAQSIGWTRDRAHALVDYTFSRPVGEPGQEVGGVMVTLAALCNTFSLDISAEAQREIARVTTPEMIAKIRAKQAAKPTGSALPETMSPSRRPVCQCGWTNSDLRRRCRHCGATLDPLEQDERVDEEGYAWSDGGKACEPPPTWWGARLPIEGETLHEAASRLYERDDFRGSLAHAAAVVMDAMARRAASTAEALR